MQQKLRQFVLAVNVRYQYEMDRNRDKQEEKPRAQVASLDQMSTMQNSSRYGQKQKSRRRICAVHKNAATSEERRNKN
jgi:hypothetical protein